MAISQEIGDGFNKSSQALQAAEAGIRRMGSMAKQQTVCMYTVFAGISSNFFLLHFPHLILTTTLSCLLFIYTTIPRNKKGVGKHT